MPAPSDAKRFAYKMDPSDVVDFMYDASPAMENTVEKTEQISSTWSLTMSAEGAAIGAAIRFAGAYAASLVENDTAIKFWLEVAPAMQGDNIFLGSGVDVPITVRWVSTNVPPRTFERTLVITIRQR